MININELNLIGKGTNRLCYEHPTDEHLCIKITHSDDFSEMKREIEYYKILQQQNISWDYIARYHGSVSTSQGQGEIFDLIKDYDGEISKTLSFYLQTEEKTKTLHNPVPLLESLKAYILEEMIVVKDLNTKNMLYQKINEQEVRLILIDGVLNNDYLPFTKYIPFFTRKKILRLWDRFEKSLPKKYAYNKYFVSLLNK